MKEINASDIQCRADESGSKSYEFESPDARQMIRVRSHSPQLAEEAANAFFKQGCEAREEHPELFA